MNLKQLEYFIACAELLNFTRAAERCYITQTGMTQQIRTLENDLDAKLFFRDKHHVQLTPAGSLFYPEAKAILRRSEAAYRLIKSATTSEEGQLSVGFIRGYGHSDLAAVLHGFHLAHPGVALHLVRDNEHGLLQMLENGELDLAFLVTPYAMNSPHISRHLLKNYPLLVAMNVDHPLANRPYLTYDDLKGEDFVLMQPPSRQYHEAEEAMFIYERGGFYPRIAAMEAEPETLLLQVAIGVGISILPEYVLHHTFTREDIRILPLVKADQSAETLSFELLWQNRHTNPILDRLVEQVLAY